MSETNLTPGGLGRRASVHSSPILAHHIHIIEYICAFGSSQVSVELLFLESAVFLCLLHVSQGTLVFTAKTPSPLPRLVISALSLSTCQCHNVTPGWRYPTPGVTRDIIRDALTSVMHTILPVSCFCLNVRRNTEFWQHVPCHGTRWWSKFYNIGVYYHVKSHSYNGNLEDGISTFSPLGYYTVSRWSVNCDLIIMTWYHQQAHSRMRDHNSRRVTSTCMRWCDDYATILYQCHWCWAWYLMRQ